MAPASSSGYNATRRSYMSSRDRQSAQFSDDPLKAGASVSAASTTTGRVPYKSFTKSPSANTMDVLDTHSTQSAENIGSAELESQKPPAFAFAVVTAGRALGAVSPSIAALSAVNRRSTRNGPERRVGKCLLQQVHAKRGSDQTVSSIQEITGGAISCRRDPTRSACPCLNDLLLRRP